MKRKHSSCENQDRKRRKTQDSCQECCSIWQPNLADRVYKSFPKDYLKLANALNYFCISLQNIIFDYLDHDPAHNYVILVREIQQCSFSYQEYQNTQERRAKIKYEQQCRRIFRFLIEMFSENAITIETLLHVSSELQKRNYILRQYETFDECELFLYNFLSHGVFLKFTDFERAYRRERLTDFTHSFWWQDILDDYASTSEHVGCEDHATIYINDELYNIMHIDRFDNSSDESFIKDLARLLYCEFYNRSVCQQEKYNVSFIKKPVSTCVEMCKWSRKSIEIMRHWLQEKDKREYFIQTIERDCFHRITKYFDFRP